ncbi:MAG: carboxypeptidase regulatory-like domain-containing protein [Bryobacteraceae bacterium]|jgi:Tfp pilus assembly protein PilF
MLRLLRRAALLAAACLILGGLGFSQSICTFKGKVINTDGKPLKDAVITLDRKEIKGSWKTKTDKKGEFVHAGIPFPGTYKVSCLVDGKVVDAIDNVPSRLGEEVEVNFDLHKNLEKSQALAKAAETGQFTKEQERSMSADQKAAMEKNVKDRQATMAKNKQLQDAYNAGMNALEAKDYQTAVDSFNKAAEVDPKQLAVWTKMTTAYEGLAKTKTGADADAAMAKASQAYQKCIEMKPEDGGVHNNYGLLLVRMKKLDEAKAELAKAAELEPASAGKYYFNLGAVMVNNQQNDAALEAFHKAVAADPKYAPAWYYIGNVLSNKLTMDKDGKPIAPPGMQEALEKYLALDPNGPYADAAKGLLSVISTSIQTTYQNPDAKKKKK